MLKQVQHDKMGVSVTLPARCVSLNLFQGLNKAQSKVQRFKSDTQCLPETRSVDGVKRHQFNSGSKYGTKVQKLKGSKV
ncbi:MAG: hypothetical protein ABIK61_05480 [candidate division WOR-3 bacterium]